MVTKAYCLTPQMIGVMTLKELEPYELAYRKEMQLKYDTEQELAWLYGIYTMNAINSSVVGNSQWFSGKNHRFNYPERPFNQEDNDKKNHKLTKEQSEQIAVYEMQRMIRNLEEIGLPMSPE